MKQREYAYDNLKFFLIVMVAVNHCSEFFQDTMPLFRGTYMFIYLFVMPAFVFVSGLFSKSSFTDIHRALKRAVYFFILYILCKLFLYIPSMILQGKMEFHLFTESGIPWYMMSMVFWYLLTYGLRKAPGYLVLAANLLLVCVIGYTDILGDFLCLSKTLVFYPFFWAGYCMDIRSLAKRTGRPVCRMIGAAVLIAGFVLAVLFSDAALMFRPLLTGRAGAYAQMQYPAFGALYRIAQYMLSAVLVFCLLAAAPRRELPVTVFGSRTLQVYFLHYYPIYLLHILPIVQMLGRVLPDFFCWLFVIAYCAAVTVCLSQKVFGRPFDWLSGVLAGR